jgi:hypothetical protein
MRALYNDPDPRVRERTRVVVAIQMPRPFLRFIATCARTFLLIQFSSGLDLFVDGDKSRYLCYLALCALAAADGRRSLRKCDCLQGTRLCFSGEALRVPLHPVT